MTQPFLHEIDKYKVCSLFYTIFDWVFITALDVWLLLIDMAILTKIVLLYLRFSKR